LKLTSDTLAVGESLSPPHPPRTTT
jgi:hypothetical protein